MAAALKCPNPSCPYLFDPTTLPTGVVLACQRCGMRFTLGNTQSMPPTAPATAALPGMTAGGMASGYPTYPSAPAGYPSAPTGFPTAPSSHPASQPSAPAGAPASQPSQFPSAQAPAAAATASRPIAGQVPRPVHTSRFQTFVLAGVTAVALAAGGVAVWYKLTHSGETLFSDTVSKFQDVNLAFEPPPSPWERDENVLGAPFLLMYKRDNPESHMAFGARDYQTRSPRASELRLVVMAALDKIIDSGTLKQDDPPENSWLGLEARGFKFHAQLKSGPTVDGEAYWTSNKGIGYFFMAWAGENSGYDEMRPAFAEARRHCRLLDLRKDWRAKQLTVVPFKGDHVGYTLLDGEAAWEEEKEESNLKYEGADKILHIKKSKSKDDIQDGHLHVYLLPGAGDPLQEARNHVEAKRKEEMKKAGDYTVEFAEAAATQDSEPLGNPVDNPLAVLRLESKVKGTRNQNRFHVVSAAKIDDKIVVVDAFCDLANRSRLEPFMVQVASSLHGGG